MVELEQTGAQPIAESSGATGGEGRGNTGGESGGTATAQVQPQNQPKPQPTVQEMLQEQRIKRFGKERAERMLRDGKRSAFEPDNAPPVNAANQAAANTEESERQSNQEPDLDEEFRQLVKDGKFKEQFTKHHQEVFNPRYRELNETIRAEQQKANNAIAELNNIKASLEPLMAAKGLKTLEELKANIEADYDLWEEGAAKNGMTVEAYKNHMTNVRELEKLQEAEQQRQLNEVQRQQFDGWWKQANDLKKEFADFDLLKELKENQAFYNMLKSNIPVAEAYKALNFDKIVAQREAAAAQKSKDEYVRSLQQRQARPPEAALGANAPRTTPPPIDYYNTTPAQRRELAEKAKKQR